MLPIAYIHVAPVTGDAEPVLAAIRELGGEKMILIPAEGAEIDRLAEVLEPIGVTTKVRRTEGRMLTSAVQLLQEIARDHGEQREDILVNLAAAGRYQACAFLSAAFVAGVRTIDRPEDQIRFLPVLQFSYDEVVGEEKLSILRALARLEDGEGTLTEVADEAGVSRSTISYEVRGGQETEGLAPLGLVEVDQKAEGEIRLRLTPMGANLGQGMRM